MSNKNLKIQVLLNAVDKLTAPFRSASKQINFIIHQYGLKARVERNKEHKVQYAQRELLGFTEQDREMIEDFVVKALADGI